MVTDGFENQALGLAITANNSTDNITKLSDDRYEIYVNDDFIGFKTLSNVTDTLDDVDDFLNSQGINGFQSHLDGDHYKIISYDTDRIKDVLKVYCHNR
ncbi:hypothetical protein ACFSO7_06335 [Bacillus sp. CGMCC 1.16607]|uniref:hypothetical protein n=1 Tax=Bacillus sp. CGMCC 1.16607 TaxID=3351842 RepID=UPI003635CD56